MKKFSILVILFGFVLQPMAGQAQETIDETIQDDESEMAVAINGKSVSLSGGDEILTLSAYSSGEGKNKAVGLEIKQFNDHDSPAVNHFAIYHGAGDFKFSYSNFPDTPTVLPLSYATNLFRKRRALNDRLDRGKRIISTHELTEREMNELSYLDLYFDDISVAPGSAVTLEDGERSYKNIYTFTINDSEDITVITQHISVKSGNRVINSGRYGFSPGGPYQLSEPCCSVIRRYVDSITVAGVTFTRNEDETVWTGHRID